MLSCDPRFRQSLGEELKQFDGNITVSNIAQGVLLIDRLEGNQSLWSSILENTPLFLRHLFPVMLTVPATNLQEIVAAAVALLPTELSNSKVAVQSRIFDEEPVYRAIDIKNSIDHYVVARQGLPTVKNPDFIVSILIASKAYVGFSRTRDNLTSWSGGAVHYGGAQNSINRAQHKLEEALEVLEIDISQCTSALDLGAAPGGWTKLLLSKGLNVTAVDTGELQPELLKNRKLTFLRQNAFNLKLPQLKFDVITCDMSWNPRNTAELLNTLAPAVKPQGKLIVTVKFMGNSPLGTTRDCILRLNESYVFIKGRHLWHNREELTLYLEKK